MSNWRPAGRMWPHCLSLVARWDVFRFCKIHKKNYQKCYQISNFWLIKIKNNGENLFTTKYNIKYFIISSPQPKFLLIKLILRPAQQFEFDLPALKQWEISFSVATSSLLRWTTQWPVSEIQKSECLIEFHTHLIGEFTDWLKIRSLIRASNCFIHSKPAVSNTLATNHMWLVGIYFVADQSFT